MANIFAQYLQPVRSVTDRMADLDAQDFRREQLSGARQQNAIQALAMRRQMEAEESGRQQQAKFANYLQQSGGDVNVLQKLLSADASMFERSQGLAKELGERDKTAAQTQQAQSAARKSEVDADKDRLAMARTQADAILQAVSAARDPASYAQAVQWLGSQGIDTSSIPQQFDPKFVQTAGQQAMSVKDRADQEWKAKGYDLDVRKQGEVERQNRAQIATTQRGQNMADSRARDANNLTKEANATVYDPERGILVNKATGIARPAATMDGKPVGNKEKPLTEGQAKALQFATRMESSNKTLGQLESDGKVFSTPGARTGLGVGAAINVVNTEKGQQLDQAKRDFINAVLRRESGAVIAESEFNNAEKQYFPQIGDAPEVIRQKAKNRRTAIEGVKADVPKAYSGEFDRISGVPSESPGAVSGFKIISVK